MPSSATITAFYAFSPFTKARASQLNTNFGNLRGHILPSATDTSTASDQTYNLGTSAYRWRSGYVAGLSLSISSGSSHILSGTTAGGFKFNYGATTTMLVSGTQFSALNATPMGLTSSAAAGGFAASAPINTTINTLTAKVVGSTCTIVTNGRPVVYGLMPVGGTAGPSDIAFKMEVAPSFGAVYVPDMKLSFLSGSTTIGSTHIGGNFLPSIGFTAAASPDLTYPAGIFKRVYFPGAGTQTLSFEYETTTTTTRGLNVYLENLRFFAYEI